VPPLHYVGMQLDFCHIAYKPLRVHGFYGQDAGVVHRDPVAKVHIVFVPWAPSFLLLCLAKFPQNCLCNQHILFYRIASHHITSPSYHITSHHHHITSPSHHITITITSPSPHITITITITSPSHHITITSPSHHITSPSTSTCRVTLKTKAVCFFNTTKSFTLCKTEKSTIFSKPLYSK
jgi:hypothetical protein